MVAGLFFCFVLVVIVVVDVVAVAVVETTCWMWCIVPPKNARALQV